jgi:hypothetical protein
MTIKVNFIFFLSFILVKMQGQFEAAAYKDIERLNKDDYVGPRYAPIGNQTVGEPFPLYKMYGGSMTDWTPSGQQQSNLKRQMNLPTNNTLFRNTQESAGVKLQNIQNNAWLYRSQTLANNGDPMSCVNNADCESHPGTTCNTQFQSWPSAKGNQGNYCAVTKYPELDSGYYIRKNASEGGIGKGCTSDNDCATEFGYFCNNETDMFGKNVQGTSFCAQTYDCPDGSKHYLGYPYGSSIPVTPPKDQNKNGRGFDSLESCNLYIRDFVMNGAQVCKPDADGKYFVVYPGYCPMPANARQGSRPAGALLSSGSASIDGGITIPSYATNAKSSITKPSRAFTAWNINADVRDLNQMSGPLQYELSINPR